MVEVIMYRCAYCGKIFEDKEYCYKHEKEHLCLKCRFHKIVGQYSDEIECTRKSGCIYD